MNRFKNAAKRGLTKVLSVVLALGIVITIFCESGFFGGRRGIFTDAQALENETTEIAEVVEFADEETVEDEMSFDRSESEDASAEAAPEGVSEENELGASFEGGFVVPEIQDENSENNEPLEEMLDVSDADSQRSEVTEPKDEASVLDAEKESAKEDRVYIYENDKVVVKAVVKEDTTMIPETAELRADKLTGQELEDAVKAVRKALDLKDEDELIYEPYDIYFLFEGTKIEPQSESVCIRMTYKDPTEDPFYEKQDAMKDLGVAHIKQSGEVEVLKNRSEDTDVLREQQEKQEEKSDVYFDVSSFSPMGEIGVIADDGSDDTPKIYICYYDTSKQIIIQYGSDSVVPGENPSYKEEMKETDSLYNKMSGRYIQRDKYTKLVIRAKLKPTSLSNYFYPLNNVTDIEGLENIELPADVSFYNLFSGFALNRFTYPTAWAGAKPTSVDWFFRVSDLNYIDLTHLDTSNVKGDNQRIAGSSKADTIILGPKTVKPNGKLVTLVKETEYDYDGRTYKDIFYLNESNGCPVAAKDMWQAHTTNGGTETYRRMESVRLEEVFNNGHTFGYYLPGETFNDSFGKPVREGYTFLGWFTEKEGGKKLNVGDTYDQKIYYAHYAPTSYKLTLHPNGASGSAVSVIVKVNETYPLNKDLFTKPGHFLSGWTTNQDGTGKRYDSNAAVKGLGKDDEEIILYAQFRPLSDIVTLTLDTGDPATTTTKQIDKGTAAGPLLTPRKDGSTFVQWCYDSPDGKAYSVKDTFDSDTTLYAKWEKNVTIKFLSGIGQNYDVVRELKIGSNGGEAPKFAEGANDYRSLMGWYTEKDGKGTAYKPNVAVNENKIYYAAWGYKPILSPNGGTMKTSVIYPLQIDKMYNISRLPVVERTGYRFLGWYLADGVTKVNAGDTVDLSKGVYITAKWTIDGVKVTLDPTLDPNPYDYYITYNYPTELSFDKNAKLVGLLKPYIGPNIKRGNKKLLFRGWFDENGVRHDNGEVLTKDLTLHAVYEEVSAIEVTFDPQGGTMLKDETRLFVYETETVGKIPGVRKEGSIFKGWFTQPGGKGTQLTEVTPITAPITYYAHYVSSTESYSNGNVNYSWTVEWANGPDKNYTLQDNTLISNPYITLSNNNRLNAQLHIRFSLDDNKGSLDPETVKIRVPKSVLSDINGNPLSQCDISVNLPKYPEVGTNQFFSYYEDGDEYVFINTQLLGSGAGMDIVLNYEQYVGTALGGSVDVSTRLNRDGYPYTDDKIEIKLEVDEDADGKVDTTDKRELGIQVHTGVSPDATMTFERITYSWENYWGTKPDDSEDYFYIVWKARPAISSTQQWNAFWSTEGTAQDGSVVYMQNDKFGSANGAPSSNIETFITMKYPKTMLDQIPQEGVKITAQAILTTTEQSGFVHNTVVEASTFIHKGDTPEGIFDKKNQRNGVDAAELPGAQNTLLHRNDSVSLFYRVSFNGSPRDYLAAPPVWDEKTKTYSATQNEMIITDGVAGDVMYSSGSAASKFIWEPETGNVPLMDSDYYISSLSINYNDQDSKMVGVKWVEPYARGINDPIDLYVRYANSSDFVYFQTINSSYNYLDLGNAGIVGYQLRHKTNAYAVKMDVIAYFKIKPTDNVKELIGADFAEGYTSVIKNQATCRILGEKNDIIYNFTTNYGGYNPANKACYDLSQDKVMQEINVSTNSSSVSFDAGKGTQEIPVLVQGYKYYTGREELVPVTDGTFEILLPAGTSVDERTVKVGPVDFTKHDYSPSSSKVYYDNMKSIDSSYFDVKMVENYNGTGRTLMTVVWKQAPDGKTHSGMKVMFTLHNTYENVIMNGNTPMINALFVDQSPNMYPSTFYTNMASKDPTVQQVGETYPGKQKAYNEGAAAYKWVSAYSWGPSKLVRGESGIFEPAGKTIPGGDYTYSVTYSQSDQAYARNLVFYDVLENGYQIQENGTIITRESSWHGTFVSVDTSAIARKLTDGSTSVTCNPVVYYSTLPRDQFSYDFLDVDNASVWTTTMPADKSTITAIAVDCRKNVDGTNFVMNNLGALSIYITMKAPDYDKTWTDPTAYNEGVIKLITTSFGARTPVLTSTLYSQAQITIKDVEPAIHKKSDPETGTAQKPHRMNYLQPLTYTLSLHNEDDELNLYEVVMEDQIPLGLKIDYENIYISFKQGEKGMKISDSPRASLAYDAQKLVFTVGTLHPGETAYFTVPTIVNVRKGYFVNQAFITGVNGLPRKIPSEITYHDVDDLVDLTIDKTVTGNDPDKKKDTFRFKIRFNDPDITTIVYTSSDYDFTGKPSMEFLGIDQDGWFYFSLRHHEYFKIENLPRGVEYEVYEIDGELQGYDVTVTNNIGTLSDDTTVSFFNDNSFKVTLPGTGTVGIVILGIIAVIAVAIALVLRHKSKDR